MESENISDLMGIYIFLYIIPYRPKGVLSVEKSRHRFHGKKMETFMQKEGG